MKDLGRSHVGNPDSSFCIRLPVVRQVRRCLVRKRDRNVNGCGRRGREDTANAISLSEAIFSDEAGHRAIYTCYVPGDAGPELFCRQLNFKPNGEVEAGEIVTILTL